VELLHSAKLKTVTYQQKIMSTKVISNYTLCSHTQTAMMTATTPGKSSEFNHVKPNKGDRSFSDSEVYTQVAAMDWCTYHDVAHSGMTTAYQHGIRDNSVLRGICA
jgi:hypothetical protein